MDSALTVGRAAQDDLRQLKAALEDARQELQVAEAALVSEQAAVNRFRMHCRLKIGVWVDDVLRQRAERQHLLTKLQLMRDSDAPNLPPPPYSDDDPFWDIYNEAFPDPNAANEERVLLPTDVPNDKASEKRLYRELARRFHPDLVAAGVQRAYATTIMAAVNDAYQRGDRVTLANLAGEMPPEELAKLEGGATPEERKLRKALLGCKRRLRKVTEQFKAMKSENTARLWRKAQRLDAQNINWWDAVRVELEVESTLLTEQLERLRIMVAVYNEE